MGEFDHLGVSQPARNCSEPPREAKKRHVASANMQENSKLVYEERQAPTCLWCIFSTGSLDQKDQSNCLHLQLFRVPPVSNHGVALWQYSEENLVHLAERSIKKRGWQSMEPSRPGDVWCWTFPQTARESRLTTQR
jgi:hypothetical protein